MAACFVVLCLILLLWGLVGIVTNQVTGSATWGEMPERGGDGWPRQTDAERRAVIERWVEGEMRKREQGGAA